MKQFITFNGLYRCIRAGYSFKYFVSDLLAGAVVTIVSIPISMALGVLTGVRPENALYTTIIFGFLTALLGGSQRQITGPTAAFIVVLAPLIKKLGLHDFFIASFISGWFLILFSILKLGRFSSWITSPMVNGFTAGIAVVIASFQLKTCLGLQFPQPHADIWYLWVDLVKFIGLTNWREAALSLVTVLGLIVFPKISRTVPAALFVFYIITTGSVLLIKIFPDFQIVTIASKYGDIPSTFPTFVCQLMPETIFVFIKSWDKIIVGGLSIAMLCAIESLVTCQFADRSSSFKHSADNELLGLGISGVIAPFFGAIPGAGAMSRTLTNIKYGAISPISALLSSGLSVLAIIEFSKQLSLIPLSALSAFLIYISFNMFNFKELRPYMTQCSKKELWIFFVVFFTTVFKDLVVGVIAGIILDKIFQIVKSTDLGTPISKNN